MSHAGYCSTCKYNGDNPYIKCTVNPIAPNLMGGDRCVDFERNPVPSDLFPGSQFSGFVDLSHCVEVTGVDPFTGQRYALLPEIFIYDYPSEPFIEKIMGASRQVQAETYCEYVPRVLRVSMPGIYWLQTRRMSERDFRSRFEFLTLTGFKIERSDGVPMVHTQGVDYTEYPKSACYIL